MNPNMNRRHKKSLQDLYNMVHWLLGTTHYLSCSYSAHPNIFPLGGYSLPFSRLSASKIVLITDQLELESGGIVSSVDHIGIS